MAKKITIPSEYKANIQHNLEDAASALPEIKTVPDTVITQDIKQPESKEIKRRVEERSADRGPMMNVHVPNEVKDMIEDIKRARRNRGIKVTVDTIIYECIQYWLADNYDKETK